MRFRTHKRVFYCWSGHKLWIHFASSRYQTKIPRANVQAPFPNYTRPLGNRCTSLHWGKMKRMSRILWFIYPIKCIHTLPFELFSKLFLPYFSVSIKGPLSQRHFCQWRKNRIRKEAHFSIRRRNFHFTSEIANVFIPWLSIGTGEIAEGSGKEILFGKGARQRCMRNGISRSWISYVQHIRNEADRAKANPWWQNW